MFMGIVADSLKSGAFPEPEKGNGSAGELFTCIFHGILLNSVRIKEYAHGRSGDVGSRLGGCEFGEPAFKASHIEIS
jgi:hypothetical protein